MADLLLELLSEEIPAKMQQRAANQLGELLEQMCQNIKLQPQTIETYVTPRRLVAFVKGLPEAQVDSTTEKKGPRTDAPEQAIEGFIRSVGLPKEALEIRDTPKGKFYFAVVHDKGKPLADLLQEALSDMLTRFSWPKSMRWGNNQLQWVRPLQRIVCLLDGNIVPCVLGHITASNVTVGHRFLSEGRFQVTSIEQYKQELEKRHVVLSTQKRKEIILQSIESAINPLGFQLRKDEVLLEEVAGLVEYPVVVLGRFDETYMTIPTEALMTAMRVHQKYFSVLDNKGYLVPYFIGVSNIKTNDAQQKIKQGYERVLVARLEDARFFWQHDCKVGLEKRVSSLEQVVFHAKLGTVEQKTKRMMGLAKFLSVWVPHADLLLAERAAQLCKADLMSQMVGEFPELQGIMGYHYALADKEDEQVAYAISEHYLPQGPHDPVPLRPLSIVVALADKIDTLAGLFAAGEIPTGSKDPLALRRTALGIIRIILQNNLRIPLKLLLEKALNQYPKSAFEKRDHHVAEKKKKIISIKFQTRVKHADVIAQLLVFLEERLRVLLKDQQIDHDVIQAVFDEGTEDDFTRLRIRAVALQAFLSTDQGRDLLAAYKRATNIVTAEEKKDGVYYNGNPKEDLLEQPQERDLYMSFKAMEPVLTKSFKKEDFTSVMQELSGLYARVNDFFEHVTVNCENHHMRKNRLFLLSRFREILHKIADFGVIAPR